VEREAVMIYIQLIKVKRKWEVVATANSKDAFIERKNSVIVMCHHNTSEKNILAEADKLWKKKTNT
jgi:hypothetical protein